VPFFFPIFINLLRLNSNKNQKQVDEKLWRGEEEERACDSGAVFYFSFFFSFLFKRLEIREKKHDREREDEPFWQGGGGGGGVV